MKKIWSSKMRRKLKIRLFRATVESILLYGSEKWTITETLAKQINGCYTRILRMALDVPWYLRAMGLWGASQSHRIMDGG